MSVVVGVDPDSKKYGVAVYIDGDLFELLNLDIVAMVQFIRDRSVDFYAVEDVKSNGFMYARNNNKNKSVAMNIAQKVGQCKQAQAHLCEFLRAADQQIVPVGPKRGNWAKNKTIFEAATGWKGCSNEDTRAAAFIAWTAMHSTRAWRKQ